MGKKEFDEDEFEEEEDSFEDFDEDEDEDPKPKKSTKPVNKAVKPSPIRKQTKEDSETDEEYYVYEQPARVGIGRRSDNKSVGENDSLLAGSLVEILNKLDKIDRNTG